MSKERSLAEAVSELKRELGIRRRCYSRWVADGKLTDVEAVDRLERMEKALEVVERADDLASVPELVRSFPPAVRPDGIPIGID